MSPGRPRVTDEPRPGEEGASVIRVLVADDHPLYREAVVTTIRAHPQLELVGEAADGHSALDQIERLDPDVALIDVRMPGLEGTQVAQALSGRRGHTRVLLLSAYHDSEVVYRALAGGAAGYLSKDASGEAICAGILAVSRGETAIAPAAQSGLVREIRDRGEAAKAALSPREQEVLELIAEGCSGPEIGVRLGVGPATVKTHTQNLYEKLEVSTRAAAVAEAMRRGLLR